MAKKEAQAFVAGPKGRVVTQAEAERMAAAMFDQIVTQQARKARESKE